MFGLGRAYRPAYLAPLLLLLLFVSAAQAKEKPDPLAKAIAKHERSLAASFRSLLRWSAGRKISGFRHKVYALILEVEPEHKSARAALGYQRDPGGVWRQGADYTPPKNWNLAQVEKAEARLTGIQVKHRDRVLKAMAQDAGLGLSRRATMIGRLLRLYPGDTTLRKDRGEVLHDGRWMLPDTVSAIKRRANIRANVNRFLVSAKRSLLPSVGALGRGWTAGFEIGGRSIVGTVSFEEIRQALLHVIVGDQLAIQLLNTNPARGKLIGPTSFVLAPNRAGARSIAKRNNWPADVRADIELVAGLVFEDGLKAVSYSTKARQRMVSGLRYVLDSHITSRFSYNQRGWITEGLGQRLTWYVAGRTANSYVSLAETERLTGEDVTKLPERSEDWLPAAAKVLETDGPPRLARVLTARLNAMTHADVLVAYGLSAYLLEARPDLAFDFIQATVDGHDAAAIVKKHLGADIATVAAHLRIWLDQQD